MLIYGVKDVRLSKINNVFTCDYKKTKRSNKNWADPGLVRPTL